MSRRKGPREGWREGLSYPRSPGQGWGGRGAVGRHAAILQEGEGKQKGARTRGCPPPGEVAEERVGRTRLLAGPLARLGPPRGRGCAGSQEGVERTGVREAE